jgi:hypothetical protein
MGRKMTEDEEIVFYGADAAEWLRRWDDNQSVWTIEMGGMGPGYEQCIHITCAEIIRFMLAQKYEWGRLKTEPEIGKKWQEEIEAMSHDNLTIKKLGLSGAQWGAACNIAYQIYGRGPREVMKDERVKDRHIQVSKMFPQE